MIAVSVLIVAALLQFVAAFLAVRLIRITGVRKAWLILALAIALMPIRRCVPLFQLISGDMSYTPDLPYELLGLVVSLLMVAGIALIAPIFLSIRRSEKALRENEQKYRTLIESSHEVIFSKNRDGRYYAMNLRAAIGLGGTCIKDIEGKTDYDLLPEEQANALQEVDKQVMQTAKFIEVEEVVRNDQGENRIYLSRKWPLYNSEGEIDGISCFAMDITEHKQAEEKIKHLNIVLQAMHKVNQLIVKERDRDRLLQNVCDILIGTRGYYSAWIVLFDKDGKFVNATEAGLEKDFLPMAEKMQRGDLTDCGRRALSQSGTISIEAPSSSCTDCPLAEKCNGRGALVIRLEYGEKVYGLLSVSIAIDFLMAEEEQSLFEEVAGDISFALYTIELDNERKRVAEALRKNEEKLQAVLQSIGDHMSMLDKDLNIVWANKTAKGIFSNNIVGRKCYEVYHKRRRPCEPYPCITLKAFKDGKIHEHDTHVLDKNGKVIHFHCTANVVLKDEEGKPMAVLEISRDITERRRLEEQIRHAQKMEAVGTLAGGLAHDFNNILAGIIGYSSLVKKSLEKGHPLLADMEAIERLSWRGSDLTAALLSFSCRGRYQPEPLNINNLIVEVIKFVERTSGKRIDMRTELLPDTSSVYADRGQIYQVIMNLCINACEAMPEGGTLTVKTANAELDKALFKAHPDLKEGPFVSVIVSDTGAGMDFGMRERIFEPFFTTKAEKSGTGLGLAVVSGIVSRHGGYIEVESVPGRGSIFKVYLPATSGKVREARPQPVVSLKGDETILLVDDDRDIRDSVERLLGANGYTVIPASNGEEALKILEKKKDDIHLVLLDMIMKGIGGEETFIRMRKIASDLPVILCTGYSLDSGTQRLLDKGANDFIQKPFDPNSLALKIRKVLDGR